MFIRYENFLFFPSPFSYNLEYMKKMNSDRYQRENINENKELNNHFVKRKKKKKQNLYSL